MRLLTQDSDDDIRALGALIDAETFARERINDLAPKILLDSMESRGWAEIVVDAEDLSRIQQIILADGTTAELDQDGLDELNDEAINIVGQCPRELFALRDREYRASRADITAWLARRI